MHRYFLRMVGILSTLLFLSCESSQQIKISDEGILDLTRINLNRSVSINLEGKLSFYWNQVPFSSSEVFTLDSLYREEKLSIFPSTWQKLGYPAKGYGTFRVKILLPENRPDLMLYIPRIESSGQVWVNGKKTQTFGVFSTVDSSAIAFGNPLYINIKKEDGDLIDLMVAVSNYHHVKGGGFPYGLSIGTESDVIRKSNIAEYMEAATVVVILIISLYHIFIIFFTDKKYLVLYFGLLCSTASVRQLFVGEAIIYNFFPDIPFHFVQLGRYLPLYLGGTFFLIYYKNLISQYSLVWVSRIIIGLFLFMAIYCMMVPTFESTFTSYVNPYLGFLCLAIVLYQVTRAFIAKVYLSTAIFAATLIAIAFLVNDLLFILKIWETTFLSNYGILFFLILQAAINYRYNREANLKAKELFERVLRLEKEVQMKKEEVNTLLTESIQQLKSKQELTLKLEKIRQTTANNIDLNDIVAELKSDKLKDHRVLILKQNIEELNYSFITQIKKNHPNLTKTDIEICSFIRLGLTSSEIASIRSTSIFSVKSSRYRIRKKMNLPKELSLTIYVKSF